MSLFSGVSADVRVSACGNTLWVNAVDGSCIGRFSKRFGVDVHYTGAEQVQGKGDCLYCTHAPAGPDEWHRFRHEMKTHHGVDIAPDLIVWPQHRADASMAKVVGNPA